MQAALVSQVSSASESVSACLHIHTRVFLSVCSQLLPTSQALKAPSQPAYQSASIAYNWPQLASIECLLRYVLNDSSRPSHSSQKKIRYTPLHMSKTTGADLPAFYNADALPLDLQQENKRASDSLNERN